MTVADTSIARFEIGRTATRTFGVIRENVITFAVLSVLAGIPLAILSAEPVLFPRTGGFPSPRAIAFYAAAGLLYILGVFLVQAGVVQGTVVSLNGQRARLSDCFSAALNVIFPLLLLTLVMSIGVGLGFVLLIVPGLIAIIMWSVAVPVRVVEKTSALGALGRSKELTRGHRWAILGLLVAFGILQFGISAIGGALAGVGFNLRAVTPQGVITAQNLDVGRVAVSVILSMINSVISAALIASIYCELRVTKEGIGPESLAAVFD